jgi:pimeloyl-ACP methyl ester carboxylesterase
MAELLAFPRECGTVLRNMKKPRRPMILLIRLLALGLVLFIVLRWFEHSQVYHPSRTLRATGAELGRPFQDVVFPAADGKQLNGWFFPCDTNSARRQWAVLICHGNAGNIGDRLEMCRLWLGLGVNVFVFDYRGFGRSEGRPGEEGTYLDAQAASRWLVGKGFSANHIIAFGESLGGGVASGLAVREPLGGLILQSTFTSTTDLGAELFPWLPVRWLSSIKYDTRRKLPGLKLPVMVMHSRTDDLIPFHHGEQNFATANEPKLFVELKGGHNYALDDPAPFVAGCEKFLKLLESRELSPSAL